MDSEGPFRRDILAAVPRVVAFLYLATLALLPWSRWPRFPWLHEHAQWSDAVFAAAAALFVTHRVRAREPVRLRLIHAGLALYRAGHRGPGAA